MMKYSIREVEEFASETKSIRFIQVTSKENEKANALYKSIDLTLDESHNYYSFKAY